MGRHRGVGAPSLTSSDALLKESFEYRSDTKTSSWVNTPPDIRERGGAIFCDRRYDHVFTYHNGAESYYAARAFRGALKV